MIRWGWHGYFLICSASAGFKTNDEKHQNRIRIATFERILRIAYKLVVRSLNELIASAYKFVRQKKPCLVMVFYHELITLFHGFINYFLDVIPSSV